MCNHKRLGAMCDPRPALTAAEKARDINFEVRDIIEKAAKVIANIDNLAAECGASQLTVPRQMVREIEGYARIVDSHYAQLEEQLKAGVPLKDARSSQSILFN